MAQEPYAARLRYLPADEVDDSYVDFDGLDVRGHDDEKLGDTDGFIVDAQAGRVLYLVVDAGGWFNSRRLLLPIGHATVDLDARALRVDVPRESLRRYPEFEKERFEKFADEDLFTFDRRTAEVCCPDEIVQSVSAAAFESRRHYAQPSWWRSPSAAGGRATAASTAAAAGAARQKHERDLVTAHAPDQPARGAGDVSPHHEGRAQPGDVLGIETGGERTYIGETAEDENERRRRAEETAPREDDPRQSER